MSTSDAIEIEDIVRDVVDKRLDEIIQLLKDVKNTIEKAGVKR